MNVAIYTRVSTEDQKENGFSLQDQQRRLLMHCKSNGKVIVAHYEEECSGKNFDRPKFKKLIVDLKSRNIHIEELWCVRFDRFSRNAYASMQMIEKLKNLGVRLRFIENDLDLTVPENLIAYMLNMVLPQVENERRGLNTIRGMRQALREGRWVWPAPKGYDNNKAAKTIEPNDDAKFILRAFKEVSQNRRPLDHIRKDLVREGFKCSKQTFYNLLRNPLYMGKIRIIAYREEPEELVDGKHSSIVPESLFYQVQDIVNGNVRKKPKQKETDKIFPLRGHLVCNTCGNNLTASRSKGRSRYYNYYHCQNGCKERHPADYAETQFEKLLESIQIPVSVMRLYQRVVKDVFESQEGKREVQVKAKEKELLKLQNNLGRVDDKLATGVLEIEDYNRLTIRIKKGIQEIKNEIDNLNTDQSNFNVYFDQAINLISQLKEHYLMAPVEIKRQIVGSIFPEKLIFTGKNYRIGKLNSVVDLITGKNWLSQRVANKKATISGGLSNLAPPLGLEPRTL
ncbi:recombinase family protein [Lentiprolixibacter aurantiacus]|uniref:Recombinase family protein n=1 Tax=Lentiprolixibacter aurantiacus TaxID=2993939 RepID=A0AAE3MJV0_9FLAO|nr:recombinase family protein [Lentiprolixibacter aurantiacus]MCX2718753.1 recombinase family protein [Lentiprolixibacter aurantiacus]